MHNNFLKDVEAVCNEENIYYLITEVYILN